MITIPATFRRATVLRQLRGCNVETGLSWHYMINRRPRRTINRLHFVHAGELIGSLPVLRVKKSPRPVALTRPDGSPLHSARRFAILAQGEFVPQAPHVPGRFAGFRGLRYWDHKCPDCSGLGSADYDIIGVATHCDTCDGSGRI